MSDLDNELGFDTLDSTIISDGAPKARPTFLTVLCILTFVGTALGFIQGLFIWFMADVYSKMFRGFGNAFGSGNQDELNAVSRVFNAFSFWGIAIVIGSIICLVGALIMWRLRKIGYFLYIGGQVIPIIGSYLAFGSIPAKELQSLAFLYVFLLSIFPIAFIIMYGLNYKHLKQ